MAAYSVSSGSLVMFEVKPSRPRRNVQSMGVPNSAIEIGISPLFDHSLSQSSRSWSGKRSR